MGAFGLRLRSEREKRGLRLVDVAKATKIGAHDLAALEYDDFDALPDAEVSKEQVRAYAEHLGLDPDDAVAEFVRVLEAGRPAPVDDGADEHEADAYKEDKKEEDKEDRVDKEEEEVAPEAPETPDEVEPRPGRWPWAVGVGLIAILILAVWWWIGAGDAREAPPLRTEPEASAPSAERVAPEKSVAEPRAAAEPDPVEAAPVETAPLPDTTPEAPPARLAVADHGVGTEVVDRRLVGEGDRFAEGTRVWFWTRVQGGRPGDTIYHVWIHEGRVANRIPLRIGGWHWRTQSRRFLSPGSTGRWEVEARDDAGGVLARSEFVCVSPAADRSD
jgi:cytoskeletal protein RodZ